MEASDADNCRSPGGAVGLRPFLHAWTASGQVFTPPLRARRATVAASDCIARGPWGRVGFTTDSCRHTNFARLTSSGRTEARSLADLRMAACTMLHAIWSADSAFGAGGDLKTKRAYKPASGVYSDSSRSLDTAAACLCSSPAFPGLVASRISAKIRSNLGLSGLHSPAPAIPA